MKLFILLALYLPTSNLFAQITWQKNYVPEKDTVFTLAQYENIIVAASPAALYITTNSGDSWLQVVSLGMDTSERVLCVGVKNNYILVGTSGGLYLSFDKGENWRQLSHRIGNSAVTTALIDRTNAFFLFTNKGVFHSPDQGATWILGDTLHKTKMANCALDSSGVLYGGSPYGGLYRSTDNGNSFSMLDDSDQFNDIVDITVTAQNVVYLTSNNYSLHYSTDHGITWRSGPEQYFVYKRNITFGHNNEIAASSYKTSGDKMGVYVSLDMGSTWQLINNGLEDSAISALCATPDGSLFAANNGGIFRTTFPVNTVKSFLLTNITAYPNPTTEHAVYLTVPLHNTKATVVRLYDMHGNSIEVENESIHVNTGTIEFLLPDIPAGIYTIICTQDRSVLTGKIICID